MGFQLERLAIIDLHSSSTTHHLLWWCGAASMVLGECCNFTAYGLSSISLVAPLNSVAIMSHVVLSRMLFKERSSRAGVISVCLIAVGTVTTVLNAPTFHGNTMAESYVFDRVVSYRMAFFTSIVIIAMLWVANPLESSLGISTQAKHHNPFYYSFLCASAGSFTVISAKGVSTAFMNAVIYDNMAMFENQSICWLTYTLFATISISIALQAKYSHSAFNAFGSNVVLSMYYIVFTIMTIAAGLVVFQEDMFEAVNNPPIFFTGLIVTYMGVITFGRDDVSLYMGTEFDHRHLTRVSVE